MYSAVQIYSFPFPSCLCRAKLHHFEMNLKFYVFCRVFVLVLVAVSVLWIPVVQASQGGQLFIYIQSISTYLQPPVSIIFLMGCFWKRTNEKVRGYSLRLCLWLNMVYSLRHWRKRSCVMSVLGHVCPVAPPETSPRSDQMGPLEILEGQKP